MWKDPIVEEIRKFREQYASQHNHDVDAIFEDMKRREAESGEKLVSYPPRRPTEVPKRKLEVAP